MYLNKIPDGADGSLPHSLLIRLSTLLDVCLSIPDTSIDQMSHAASSGLDSGLPVSPPGNASARRTTNRNRGRCKNLAALEKALEVEFAKDPVRFFRSIIMPLLPKESKLELDRDGVIRWQSLLGKAEMEKIE